MDKNFKVNAFIGENLLGNPASVYIGQEQMDTATCQDIAAKNQSPVTAFVFRTEDHFIIRWFTPLSELSLCGHGTLSASFVIYERHLNSQAKITFYSPQAGQLTAIKKGKLIFLNFPIKQLTPIACPPNLIASLGGINPIKVFDAEDRILAVLSSWQQVKNMQPNIELLKTVAQPGIVITAPGDSVDFVSRTFYPYKPNWEDAVTGASHCALTPYWTKELKKEKLHAHQLSPRGGEIYCIEQGTRVLIGGQVQWDG